MFTIHKIYRRFSAFEIDHSQNQNNAMVKGDGRAIGLTKDSNAFRRRMTSGSKIAGLGHEFEALIKPESGGNQEILKLHDEQRSNKSTLFKDIRLHFAIVEESGKPLLEEIQDLLALDTKDVAG